MNHRERAISAIGAARVISALGGLYIVLAAGWAIMQVAEGAPVSNALLQVVGKVEKIESCRAATREPGPA